MLNNNRDADILRRVEGGATWESLRRTGVAEEGDLTRLVDKGLLTTNFARGAVITDSGRQARNQAEIAERQSRRSQWDRD